MKKRTFISIDIPKEIQKEIVKIQEKLPGFIGKKTKPENLHLTLKFLGETEEEHIYKVTEMLKEIKASKYETEAKYIGVFSEKFIRIIWIHLTNCNILQEKIDTALSSLFEKETRFMSHLTIARVKSVKNKKDFLEILQNIEFPKISFIVDNFRFKESILTKDGPIYKTIEEYKFIDSDI